MGEVTLAQVCTGATIRGLVIPYPECLCADGVLQECPPSWP
jgi:hypothetical protein